jgi:hypothetical protein
MTLTEFEGLKGGEKVRLGKGVLRIVELRSYVGGKISVYAAKTLIHAAQSNPVMFDHYSKWTLIKEPIGIDHVVAALDQAFRQSTMDKSTRAVVLLAFADNLKGCANFDAHELCNRVSVLPSYVSFR